MKRGGRDGSMFSFVPLAPFRGERFPRVNGYGGGKEPSSLRSAGPVQGALWSAGAKPRAIPLSLHAANCNARSGFQLDTRNTGEG